MGLVAAYTFLVLFRMNTYESRMLVGVVGILNALLAFIESIGFCSWLGVRGNMTTYTVPALLVGIGVDDMYVMLKALQNAPDEFDVLNKVKYMTMTSGVSITITSLTNIAGFAAGTFTQLPALESFAYFAVAGVFFDYFNQMTFFLAVVVWDLRRSARQGGDCAGLYFCKPSSKVCCGGKFVYDSIGKVHQPFNVRVFRAYSKVLIHTCTRVLVSVLTLVAAGAYAYACTLIEPDFDIEWVVLDEFQVAEAIDIRQTYYKEDGPTLAFFSVEADFPSEAAQEKTVDLANALEACKGCGEDWVMPGTVISWYSHFNAWVGDGQCSGVELNANQLVPPSSFETCLGQ